MADDHAIENEADLARSMFPVRIKRSVYDEGYAQKQYQPFRHTYISYSDKRLDGSNYISTKME